MFNADSNLHKTCCTGGYTFSHALARTDLCEKQGGCIFSENSRLLSAMEKYKQTFKSELVCLEAKSGDRNGDTKGHEAPRRVDFSMIEPYFESEDEQTEQEATKMKTRALVFVVIALAAMAAAVMAVVPRSEPDFDVVMTGVTPWQNGVSFVDFKTVNMIDFSKPYRPDKWVPQVTPSVPQQANSGLTVLYEPGQTIPVEADGTFFVRVRDRSDASRPAVLRVTVRCGEMVWEGGYDVHK